MLWIIGLDGIVEGLRRLAGAGPARAAGQAARLRRRPTEPPPLGGAGVRGPDLPAVHLHRRRLDRLLPPQGPGPTTGRRGRGAGPDPHGALVPAGRADLQRVRPADPRLRGQTHADHAVRWLGVLQRIAICYGATALLFCFLRARYLVPTAVLLLVGYWLLMSFVNVPGVGRGSYAEGRNLANYLDQHYLGGFKWDGDHDPEGYLSTLPAIATCLLGVFAGLLLRSDRPRPAAEVRRTVPRRRRLAGLGYAWGCLPSPVHMPVIKKLWTSSYVLLAGGYSAMMLAVFYLVIDVWRLEPLGRAVRLGRLQRHHPVHGGLARRLRQRGPPPRRRRPPRPADLGRGTGPRDVARRARPGPRPRPASSTGGACSSGCEAPIGCEPQIGCEPPFHAGAAVFGRDLRRPP